MTCPCDRKNQYWCVECDWFRRQKNMKWLCRIYEPWRKKNNFEEGCAEELHFKLLDDPNQYKPQLKWLKKFIRIWEVAEHG